MQTPYYNSVSITLDNPSKDMIEKQCDNYKKALAAKNPAIQAYIENGQMYDITTGPKSTIIDMLKMMLVQNIQQLSRKDISTTVKTNLIMDIIDELSGLIPE